MRKYIKNEKYYEKNMKNEHKTVITPTKSPFFNL